MSFFGCFAVVTSSLFFPSSASRALLGAERRHSSAPVPGERVQCRGRRFTSGGKGGNTGFGSLQAPLFLLHVPPSRYSSTDGCREPKKRTGGYKARKARVDWKNEIEVERGWSKTAMGGARQRRDWAVE